MANWQAGGGTPASGQPQRWRAAGRLQLAARSRTSPPQILMIHTLKPFKPTVLPSRASLPPREEFAAWVESEAVDARCVAAGRPLGATRRFNDWQMAHHRWLARSCGPDVQRVLNWTAAALHAYWAVAWAASVVQQGALVQRLGGSRAA